MVSMAAQRSPKPLDQVRILVPLQGTILRLATPSIDEIHKLVYKTQV